jgi:hypothetical protein
MGVYVNWASVKNGRTGATIDIPASNIVATAAISTIRAENRTSPFAAAAILSYQSDGNTVLVPGQPPILLANNVTSVTFVLSADAGDGNDMEATAVFTVFTL